MREAEEMSACPICQRSVRTKRMRRLYELAVCAKCRNAFANRRQFAYIVDSVLLYVITRVLYWGIFYVLGSTFRDTDEFALFVVISSVLLGWVVFPFLFSFKDGFSGQSPGKWLCGVRVVDQETYQPIGFERSLKRNLILMIPILPLIVAFQLLSGKRLGDGWAKTRVIWKKYAYKPPFDIRGLLCTHCGYDLTGNVSGRCPECGTDIPRSPQAVPLAVAVGQPTFYAASEQQAGPTPISK